MRLKQPITARDTEPPPHAPFNSVVNVVYRSAVAGMLGWWGGDEGRTSNSWRKIVKTSLSRTCIFTQDFMQPARPYVDFPFLRLFSFSSSSALSVVVCLRFDGSPPALHRHEPLWCCFLCPFSRRVLFWWSSCCPCSRRVRRI